MIFLNFPKNFLFFSIFCALLAFTPAHSATNDEQEIRNFFKDLAAFTRAFNDIKRIYVDEIDNEELFKNAIKGMVTELDPHSDYLKPKEQKKLIENTAGKFGGLGIVISMKDKLIEVISPIDDTPAYRAGIQSGDLIVEIDGESVNGMTLEEGVGLMRGTPNSSVQITVVRKNEKAFKVDIIREIITIVSVKSYLLEADIGYVRISNFQAPTITLLKEAVNKLMEENEGELKGFILDLRNNPGGILNGAVDVANLFIDKTGLVVYTKGRIPNSNVEYPTKPADIISGIPMVVLINEGSASASEIVAGALQDHKRAIIMGKTSFGKGSVQSIIELDDGYGLKITTARYYTPSGRSIQAEGIEPDIALDNIRLVKATATSVISPTKEKDLKGHLEVEDPTELSEEEILEAQADKTAENTKKTIERLKTDYFVHEAKNLLKALIILEK